MNLSEYFISEGGTGTIQCSVIAKVARTAGCSHETLYMISKGHKKASYKLAQKLEAATDGKVTKHEIREDIFGPKPNSRARKAA